MKVYLAGKIAKNDWRHGIVRGLREAATDGCMEYPAGVQFPSELPGAIFGKADYVGPFFVGCDHGCWHGDGTHGVINANSMHDYGFDTRLDVYDRSFDAIRRCDLFFAWIECKTAYGTLVEIGMAYAMGKHVVVASPGPIDDDLWFCTMGSPDTHWAIGFAPSPIPALMRAIATFDEGA